MKTLYQISLYLGVGILRLLAPFNRKLGLFFQDRAKVWAQLKSTPSPPQSPLLWVHVASLGEFEQARPLIEMLREQRPKYRLLLTFFSPSGYKVRATYEKVDTVTYLPLDFPAKMSAFFDLFSPSLGIIFKHDIWPNMCFEAKKRGIPLVSVAAFFRPSQVYFRGASPLFQSVFLAFDAFLVCHATGAQLLRRMHCQNVEVMGDPKYDGVEANSKQKADFPFLSHFKATDRSIVLWGSLWPDEWKNCAQVIAQTPELQHIVVPHEPQSLFLDRIRGRFPQQVVRYSCYEEDLKDTDPASRILLIDSVGMLARMYRYAQIAYVGGGKRGGLHNILEPAVYGVPVIFWGHKAHLSFPEAEALRQSGGAAIIHNTSELLHALSNWAKNPAAHKQASSAASAFVKGRVGATQKIYQFIEKMPALQAKPS